MNKRSAMITTSWDDGHPYDLRLAELLEKYGLQGTFYVPLNNLEHDVMDDGLLRQIACRFEIGGHTVNHRYLKRACYEEARFEIFRCKEMLEDKISKEILGFCFPGGEFAGRDIGLAKAAGFLYGRTTTLFDVELKKKFLMNTSVQIYKHSALTLLKHCIKHMKIAPVIDFGLFIKHDKSFSRIIDRYLERILDRGGVMHIWGHSWEIDEYNLWYELEEIFKMISSDNRILYLQNRSVWQLANEVAYENTAHT